MTRTRSADVHDDDVRSFYRSYHDAIGDKRLDSPFPLRRYVHRALQTSTLQAVLEHVSDGATVLDAGCGEGSLIFALAEALERSGRQGVRIMGVDLSAPNLVAGLRRAVGKGVRTERIGFQVADLERLPFPDESFDVVVSSHVLEHLPHFDRGLAEIRRVTRATAVLGLPTCLNPCAMAILGGDNYWAVSRRTPYALWLGLWRTLTNLGGEGVDEGYVGHKDLPHVWRYPWVLRRQIQEAGFEIVRFEAPTIPLPYLPGSVPGVIFAQRHLDRLRKAPLFRNLGYGSIVVARKR